MTEHELKSGTAGLGGTAEGWHENGQIRERRNYKNGELDGLYETWYENGQMQQRLNCKNGKLDGLCEDWYKDGQMWARSNWKDGWPDGLYEHWIYFKDGPVLVRERWKDGKIVEKFPDNPDPKDRGTPAPRQPKTLKAVIKKIVRIIKEF